MKLSEQLVQDFLKEAYPENQHTRTYDISLGYLTELIYKVHVLEERVKELETAVME
jgi:hypothetical protein